MVSGVLFTQNKKYLLKSISLDIYTNLIAVLGVRGQQWPSQPMGQCDLGLRVVT